MAKQFKKVVANKEYKITLGRRQAEKMTEATMIVNETPTTFIKSAALQRAQNIVDVVKGSDDT